MSRSVSTMSGVSVRQTRYRWCVLALIFVIYTVASADRANIGIALPYIQKEFGLSNTQVGTIISLFGLAYGLFQIPAAFLNKVWGVRLVLPFFMVMTSLATATMGMVGSVVALQVTRFALGVAEAPLANSLMTTVNNWFPAREKGQAAGIFISSAKFGPVIVPPLGALVILHFGWEYVFFVCAVPGVLLALVWWVLVPNDPGESRFCSPQEVDYIHERAGAQAQADTAKGPVASSGLGWLDRVIRAQVMQPIDSVPEFLRSWTAWGVTLGYFFTQGTISVILAWLPTYLTKVKQFSILNVGFVAAAPFVGAVLGNILGGWLSDRVFQKRRKPTMMLSTISTVVMMYALVHAPNDPVALSALLFLTGLLLSFGFSAFGIYPSAMTTKKAFPVAAALINTGGQIGAAVLPLAVGIILDRADWNAVFLFLSSCSLAAFVLLLTIVEPLAPSPADT
ncbi:MAG: MFS transporter [Alphaproteobacteria bacterium]|nr:MAG: MFS transporter [Alphaproteobacteria bacterium]